ncbi:Protein-serine/threonine phosphatase [Purpureocillium takamizusanense]|uniref:RNA polymerase II subunit B1 CTD phosphatase RPAP2 homolog n=1 Tax=Purpureocillium takamizusanense TaxID=2060973 RepID=A0A9Q8QCD8_9HYPO|nr:Protein-serine/threonine phosphatase [Purpureocillium takamizusanense]UNI16631.1 Protein-serine/threonine phosphatase [Purpureocillium takamizusanense]
MDLDDIDDNIERTIKGTVQKRNAAPLPSPEEARKIAIHHATLLQHRKDLEARILDSIIELSEYPRDRSPQYSAASPAPADAEAYKQQVRLFQPSDHKDLVEERNVNGLCGYTLCPKPHRDTGPGGKWTIRGGAILERKNIEMWCSEQCTKRAMYVQVQLSETAAWERVGNEKIRIDLLDEPKSSGGSQDAETQETPAPRSRDPVNTVREATALALERGEKMPVPGSDRVKVDIQERETKPPRDTAIQGDKNSHLSVEGYVSRLPFRPKPQS